MMPTPHCTCGGCTCGASKTTADQAVFTRLIQFLMGLSESFDHLRDQLLVMDPVPTVNKAYSMVLRVEKTEGGSHGRFREYGYCSSASPSTGKERLLS
ncbi:UNVERIFIED_CONTAM: hypothetical protein Sangu_0091900 [Sesamum angustifolium]|uniref:Uncharacterized protein n=1 Tax=Sesamum angustifolium TaxID=2727405 RepID=A0AAW2RL53_9LAMI